MNKKKLIFFTFLLCNFLFSQTNFEKGYYINSSNQKIEGFIKNSDWKNNPNKIEFKADENSETITIPFDQMNEFLIESSCKYKKFNIEIEKSSNDLKNASLESEPIFEKETTFLKILVEGEASLYKYENNGLVKYFYSTPLINIEQLILINHFVSEQTAQKMRNEGSDVYSMSTVFSNEKYKKQLFQNVNCNFSREEVKNVVMTTNSLQKYFTKYNQCKNVNYEKYERKQEFVFNVSAVVVANQSSLNLNFNNDPLYSKKFEKSLNIGFGIDLEIILPFNNNKWGVYMQPTYNSYKENALLIGRFDEQNVDITFNFIQLPVGIRHYIYLNSSLKMYLNAAVNTKYPIGNNKIDYENNDYFDMDYTPSMWNYSFGGGINYNKISLGVNLFSRTQISKSSYNKKYANYDNISLDLRYKFL